jgi:hypothetical protein
VRELAAQAADLALQVRAQAASVCLRGGGCHSCKLAAGHTVSERQLRQLAGRVSLSLASRCPEQRRCRQCAQTHVCSLATAQRRVTAQHIRGRRGAGRTDWRPAGAPQEERASAAATQRLSASALQRPAPTRPGRKPCSWGNVVRADRSDSRDPKPATVIRPAGGCGAAC